MGLVALMAIYPQESVADGFTGDDFLKWDRSAQDSYFQTSLTMAAIIATETNKPSGDCLADWYLSPDADRDSRNTELRSIIEQNAAFHPSSVIYLVLAEECGPFIPPSD